MLNWALELPVVAQAFLGGLGTWALTALGTLPVLFVLNIRRNVMDAMMGTAAGIMMAAACWSLLVPALDQGTPLVVVAGFLTGAGFLFALDKTIPHLHSVVPNEAHPEGPPVAWRRPLMLMTAITIHNIPEGVAVGVGFGSGDTARALALTMGIGIQNIPEGLAIAMPLRRDGMSRTRAFFYGQLSAVVEPVAAVAGATFVAMSAALLPFVLAFAAGAMIFVVVEELIPETTRNGQVDAAALGFIAGFALMMSLDQIAR
jgi:ZIP family zinc transporter